jgi:hypothetical protein
MDDPLKGARTFKVPAKTALEATYRVAIEYSNRHFFREKPGEGETLFEVSITATPVKR